MLGKLLGVRGGEWKKFLFFFHLNLIQAVGITVGSTAAFSLFLVRFGVGYMPLMFILTSALTLVAMSLYNNLLGRIRNERLFLVITAACAAAVAAVWCLVRSDFMPVYLVLYPCYSIVTALSYSQTFVLMYDYFDAQESKRMFPSIVSGISLGGIIGGFGVKALLAFMAVENLFLVWVALIGVAGVSAALIGRIGLESVVRTVAQKKKSALGFFAKSAADFHAVMSYPLVRTLIFSTFTITIAFFFTEFLSSRVFLREFPGEGRLTSFLGIFTGVANVIGLLAQVVLLPRILARVGVANADFIYPGFMFAGLAALLAWPALLPACLGYFNRKFLSYSVGEPVERLLFNGLPEQMKGRASAFVKGYVVPIGAIAASLMIIAVNRLLPAPATAAFTVLAAAGFAFSFIALHQRFKIKRLYVSSLVSLVSEKRVNLEALAEDWKKIGESGLEKLPIREYLDSGDDSLYAMTLEFIASAGLKKHAAKLTGVYPSKSLEMRAETLKTIARIDGAGHADFILQQARAGEPELRALAVKILGELGNDEVYEKLVIFLGDPEEKVRSAAIVAVCRSGDLFHMSAALTLLNNMFTAGDPAEFLRGVDILVDSGDRRYIKALAGFLREKPDAPRQKLVNAICALETGADDRFLETFLAFIHTERGTLQGAVLDALRKIASGKSIGPIAAEFNNMSEPNKIKAVETLGRTGAPAFDRLTAILQDPTQSHNVRIDAIRQLDRIPSKETPAALERLAGAVADHIYAIISLPAKLAETAPPPPLLDFVLDEMIAQNTAIWLHVAARTTRKTQDVIMLIEPLLGPRGASKANAIETLENLIDKNSFNLILPVLDDVADEEKLAAAGRRRGCADADCAELYEVVMDNSTPWHHACMLASADCIAARDGGDTLARFIRKGLELKTPEADEAAAVLASKAGPPPDIKNAAGAARTDYPKGDTAMLSTFEKIMFLKKVETFAGLDSHGLRVLSGISTVQRCSHGEIIFEEGDPGDTMYVIHKGKVRLYLKSNPAKTLASLDESDYFGEMAVLDGEPRSACAAAETDCNLIRINRDHFIELIREYPLITIPIFKALSSRLRKAQG